MARYRILKRATSPCQADLPVEIPSAGIFLGAVLDKSLNAVSYQNA